MNINFIYRIEARYYRTARGPAAEIRALWVKSEWPTLSKPQLNQEAFLCRPGKIPIPVLIKGIEEYPVGGGIPCGILFDKDFKEEFEQDDLIVG